MFSRLVLIPQWRVCLPHSLQHAIIDFQIMFPKQIHTTHTKKILLTSESGIDRQAEKSTKDALICYSYTNLKIWDQMLIYWCSQQFRSIDVELKSAIEGNCAIRRLK